MAWQTKVNDTFHLQDSACPYRVRLSSHSTTSYSVPWIQIHHYAAHTIRPEVYLTLPTPYHVRSPSIPNAETRDNVQNIAPALTLPCRSLPPIPTGPVPIP
jgi:hypothetical protein